VSKDPIANVVSTLEGVKDVLTVRRVFGDPYVVGDVTVIPVATVRGGGGGGGGEGTGTEGRKEGSGAGGGLGFGVHARPVGVYVVRDGDVTWQPSVDVMRIVLGGQLLGAIALLSLRAIFRKH
jgi:uncharacterized spore protein YtfJ